MRMSYYWFNRNSKKKLLRIIICKTKSIKEKSKNQYKNLSEEEKDKIKEYQRKRY